MTGRPVNEIAPGRCANTAEGLNPNPSIYEQEETMTIVADESTADQPTDRMRDWRVGVAFEHADHAFGVVLPAPVPDLETIADAREYAAAVEDAAQLAEHLTQQLDHADVCTARGCVNEGLRVTEDHFHRGGSTERMDRCEVYVSTHDYRDGWFVFAGAIDSAFDDGATEDVARDFAGALTDAADHAAILNAGTGE